MSLISEFKKFAVKGNVVDLAVAVIVGGAFGKIVNSFVEDILMPPIGLLIGGVDFSELKIVLKAASSNQAQVSINYGAFAQVVIHFFIIAFSIFMLVKLMNKLKRNEEEAQTPEPVTPAPTRQEVLLEEIRDLLKR